VTSTVRANSPLPTDSGDLGSISVIFTLCRRTTSLRSTAVINVPLLWSGLRERSLDRGDELRGSIGGLRLAEQHRVVEPREDDRRLGRAGRADHKGGAGQGADAVDVR